MTTVLAAELGDIRHALAVGVVLAVLAAVAIGRVPLLRMNRATTAFVGAVLLVALGALSLDQAFGSLDLGTLGLLFALMAVNVCLDRAGFFRRINAAIIGRTRSAKLLLAGIIVLSGVLSALLLNDTIVLMFTPLIVDLTIRLERNPLPYLMGLATASNIGSTATITGNPQNILIGTSSGLSFLEFSGALSPVALGGLVIAWVVIVLVYRQEFSSGPLPPHVPKTVRHHGPLLAQSLVALAVMIAACVAGTSVPSAALFAGAIVLANRRLNPDRLLGRIDWSLLVFFAGLFVVTGAVSSLGLSERLFEAARPLAEGGIAPLSGVGLVLSNLVSNVPAVMLFRPIVPNLPDPTTAWLTLAMSTTLAGNLTLIGSVANLIVAESARRRGVELSFVEYLKTGVPITLLTLGWGILWLTIR